MLLLRAVAAVVMALLSVAGVRSVQALPGTAAVEVTDAWARPAVPGQHGTGAFMTLKSKQPARLVGAASPVAGVVEIHEMAMEGNVMRMRAVGAIELPADRVVELRPGGYHVMLLDLKRPLKVGEKIEVDLQLESADRRRWTQPVQVEVRMRAPGHEPKH